MRLISIILILSFSATALLSEEPVEDRIGSTVLLAPGGNCDYVIGDANGSDSYNGLDITWGVNYFKGGNPPPYECECTTGDIWYVSGDVNASCSYNGLDITWGVNYFKGGLPPVSCPDCPPSS